MFVPFSCFQNFVVVLTSVIAWLIPDIPSKTKERIRQEAFITQKVIMKEELRRAREDKALVRDLLLVGKQNNHSPLDNSDETRNRKSYLPPFVKEEDVDT